jgi:Condensation domain/TubC N-terminal docking domain
MTHVADILLKLRRRGVRVWSEGDHLRYTAPVGVLDAQDKQILRALRAEIISFLRQPSPAAAGEPPLRRRSPLDKVPLTFSQQWIWNILDLEKKASRAGIIPRALRLIGQLHTDSLRQCLIDLIRRHESLRTRLVRIDSSVTQHIDAACEYDLTVADLTNITDSRKESEARRTIERLTFGISAVPGAPLFEVALIKLADCHHILLVTIDHIISDGASLAILLRDIFALYARHVYALPDALPEIPIQFPDYAVWQQQTRKEWAAQHENYWKERLSGARRVRPPAVRTAHHSAAMKKLPFDLGKSLTERLRRSSQRGQTTLAISVLTAYMVTVMHWYAQSDLVIPLITLGRHHPELENTIGFFGVPLFLRISLLKQDTFADLLARITHEYRNACEHHDSCRIVAQHPQPDFAWNPMFNWLPHNLDGLPPMASSTGDYQELIKIEPFELDLTPPDPKWEGELRIDISDTSTGAAGTIGYRTDYFTSSDIDRFGHMLRSFAEQLATAPEALALNDSARKTQP